MTQIIRTSFAAGEISSDLDGRVDLAKYQTGLRTCRNMFVGYRGGAISRPGTQHVGLPYRHVTHPEEEMELVIEGSDPLTATIVDLSKPRLLPFIFNTEQAYVLELNHQTMRIISDGEYVVEAEKSITAAANADPLTITVPGHGYANGDFVRVIETPAGLVRPNGISGMAGRYFRVIGVVGNVLTLGAQDNTGYPAVDAALWTAWISGGTVARIVEVATPWDDDDLFTLNYAQSADVMTVVHNDYPAYNIIRTGLTTWLVQQETYGSAGGVPVVTLVYPDNNDGSKQQYFYAYVVTSIDANGRESAPSGPGTVVNRGLDQINTPAVTNRVFWNPVSGAAKYRVYKAQPVPSGFQGGGPWFYGAVAETYQNLFVDINYAPDFTTGPPVARNPFLDNGLASVSIIAGGSGYVSPTGTIVDGTGTGATIALQADTSITAAPYGEIVSGQVIIPGTGYTAPTVTVGDAAGPGTGLTLAFNGSWIANPVPASTGFVPAPGSITIASGGVNYHAATYAALVTCVAENNPIPGNSMKVRVTQVVNGTVTAIAFAWATDFVGVATTGLSATGTGDDLVFTVGVDSAVGSGANVTVALGGTSNPSCVAYHEQRKVFAGTIDLPTTVFFSRIGQYTNFDISDPVQEDDAITASLVANEVNIITGLISMTSGLIALTSGGVYLLSGGQDKTITITTIQAKAQQFIGSLKQLAPLRVSDRLLYSQARGSAVRDLAFNFVSITYTGQDVSVLSAHLLENRRIQQWAYAEEPNKCVWAVRDDGIMLSLTYLKEQDVYGWARHDTQGQFVSVCSIPEGNEDVPYVVALRHTDEMGWYYSTERMVSRNFGANPAANIPSRAEEAWCVDNGARYELTMPATKILSLTMTGPLRGTLTFEANAFSSDDAGSILRVRGGLGEVYQCPAPNQLIIDWQTLPQGLQNYTYGTIAIPNIVFPLVDEGEWSLTKPVSVIGGLDHMNGALVQILADGNVLTAAVVEDGCIELENEATRIVAGLGYSCQMQTMRLEMQGPGFTTMQGDRKNIIDITIRSKDTRGVMYGSDWEHLMPFSERTTEAMGEATRLMEGGRILEPPFEDGPGSNSPVYYADRFSQLNSRWDQEGIVCIQQSWPLPMTILAIIPDIDKGDTAND